MYEGGIRVAAAARWPGKIRPGSRTARMSLTMDIFATLCNVAGAQPPPEIDGVSFLPSLLGSPQEQDRSGLYFVRREGGAAYGGKTIEAIFQGEWKLLQDSPFGPLELYNIQRDPLETTNLAAKQKRVLRELSASLRRQIQRGGQTPWQ